MRKFVLLILSVFTICGCATTKDVPTSEILKEPAPAKVEEEVKEERQGSNLPELENVDDKEMEEYTQKRGVVFAKTQFQGVLETTYVQLTFEGQGENKHGFQLHIGEENKQAFAWDVKTVKPGYFFIELPAGVYKISSISIPVGSAIATEKVDITLEVIPDQIVYLGTLNANGTKEKLKLGGVPVIKPGFEYQVKVIDQQEEGINAFRKRYPNVPNDIIVNLMEINSIPESET